MRRRRRREEEKDVRYCSHIVSRLGGGGRVWGEGGVKERGGG